MKLVFRNHLYTHRKTGRKYKVVDQGRFKENGEWIDAVYYRSVDSPTTIYGRSVTAFLNKFQYLPGAVDDAEERNVQLVDDPERLRILRELKDGRPAHAIKSEILKREEQLYQRLIADLDREVSELISAYLKP